MDELVIFRGGVFLIIATCVPLLLFIGYKLFVMGAQGSISISHSSGETSSKLTNLSPGAFCFFLSIVLGYFLIGAKASVFFPEDLESNSGNPSDENSSKSGQIQSENSKNLQFQWFSGGSLTLSRILVEEYSKVGICLHRQSFINSNKDVLLKDNKCFDSINVMVKIPLNSGGITDLINYERAASEGDPVAIKQLDAWRFDNLKDKSKP